VEKTFEMSGDYPLGICTVHPGAATPGYSVCVHVERGADIAVHYAPEQHEVGHILCARCYSDELSCDPHRLVRVASCLELHCVECVMYHLGARLPAAEVVGLAVMQ